MGKAKKRDKEGGGGGLESESVCRKMKYALECPDHRDASSLREKWKIHPKKKLILFQLLHKFKYSAGSTIKKKTEKEK